MIKSLKFKENENRIIASNFNRKISFFFFYNVVGFIENIN